MRDACGPRAAAARDAGRGDPSRTTRHGRLAAIVSLIAGAAIGLTPPASAADYYVGGGSCSDAGPGTLTTPYCTITAALAAHHGAGTTLNVLPGVYREQVTLPASGAAGSPLTLRALGAPDQPVVIDGADDFSDPARWE